MSGDAVTVYVSHTTSDVMATSTVLIIRTNMTVIRVPHQKGTSGVGVKHPAWNPVNSVIPSLTAGMDQMNITVSNKSTDMPTFKDLEKKK